MSGDEPEWMRKQFGQEPAGEERNQLRVVQPGEQPRLGLRTGNQIRTRPVQWAWFNRLVKGELNLVDAPPGSFKTTFMLWVAAQLSRGAPLPGEDTARRPTTTVFFSPEEDVGVSGLPKFLASGGVRERFVEISRTPGSDLPQMVFPSGAALFDQALKELEADEHQLGLVILDGLSVILEDGRSEHSNTDVRRALESLLSVTRKRGVTVVGIRHMGKATHADVGNWGIGSVAWRGMARSQWVVLGHPEQEGRYIFANTKPAYSASKPTSLVFEGRSADVALDDGTVQSFGTIEVVEESELSGAQWAARITKKQKRKASKEELEAATTFLRAALQDAKARPYDVLAEQAKADAGIPKSVLWQAAQELKKSKDLKFTRDAPVEGKEQPLQVYIPLARAALGGEI